MKTHVVEAEVVSADATAKTLTIKGDPNKTVAVDASAVSSLKSLKAGEKVKLTCRDSAKGEHEAVTHITVEKAKTRVAGRAEGSERGHGSFRKGAGGRTGALLFQGGDCAKIAS